MAVKPYSLRTKLVIEISLITLHYMFFCIYKTLARWKAWCQGFNSMHLFENKDKKYQNNIKYKNKALPSSSSLLMLHAWVLAFSVLTLLCRSYMYAKFLYMLQMSSVSWGKPSCFWAEMEWMWYWCQVNFIFGAQIKI